MGILVNQLAALSLCVLVAGGELPRITHQVKEEGSLSLLVVGDWGRRGLYNQSEVAAQMGRIGEGLGIDFVVSTGDNFYEDGLTSVEDPSFFESFANMYTAPSLQTPWYTVLGNHDYRGDVLAQLDPILRTMDSRWRCKRSFILEAGLVEFFFVDTSPMVMQYWENPEDHKYDWRGVGPRDVYVKNLLENLDMALETSEARWKFVVGHHTIRSVSSHGDTQELVEILLPILERRNVDLYINGHDHCLEHISSRHSELQFLTSGGGSKAWRGLLKPNEDEVTFFYDGQGFMSMQVTLSVVKVIFYDINGRAIYTWEASKDLPLSFGSLDMQSQYN
ncbi:purple acid phosphatase 4-like [Wolffia australiana]